MKYTHKLAESMIVIDAKIDFLDGQTRPHSVIIDDVPETENERWSESEEKVLIFFRDKLDLDHHTIVTESDQRVRKVSKAADGIPGSP